MRGVLNLRSIWKKIKLFRKRPPGAIAVCIDIPASEMSFRIGKTKTTLTKTHNHMLYCMVASSFDTRPMLSESPAFAVPEHQVTIKTPVKPGIFALTVDVFIQGVKPSDGLRDVVKADPKWAFHLTICEWNKLSCDGVTRWISTAVSNDGTNITLELCWNFSQKLVNVDTALIQSIRSQSMDVKTLHETLRRNSRLRAEEIAGFAAQLSKDDSVKQVVMANFFRVPCSVAGPILQDCEAPVTDDAAQLLVDFEQAVAFNRACVALRPEYWATVLMHLLLEGLTKAYQKTVLTQLPTDETECCGILRGFLETSVSARELKDLVFESASEYTASHSRYTADAQISAGVGVGEDLVVDGSGESQLMSGINYVCSTLLRRKQMTRAGLSCKLPAALQDPLTYSGEIEPFDCEDGSYQVAAAMAFIDTIALADIETHFTQCAKRQCLHIPIFVPLLVEACRVLKECDSRCYLPTLGTAKAASVAQFKPALGGSDDVRPTRKANFEAFEQSMRDGSACGHSWAVGFDAVALQNHGRAVLSSFSRPMHCEQTSDTERPDNTDVDSDVTVHFESSSSKLKEQLSKFQDQRMPFSMACSIKNDIFAQCLSESIGKTKHINFTGVQYANNKEKNGFLQYIICAGGHLIFAADDRIEAEKNYFSPVCSIPFYDSKTTCTLRVPISSDETEAITALASASIAQFPTRPGIFVLPPFCLQTFGATSDVRILARHSADTFDANDPHALVARRKLEMAEMQQKKINCCGFRILEICRTIFFFGD